MHAVAQKAYASAKFYWGFASSYSNVLCPIEQIGQIEVIAVEGQNERVGSQIVKNGSYEFALAVELPNGYFGRKMLGPFSDTLPF